MNAFIHSFIHSFIHLQGLILIGMSGLYILFLGFNSVECVMINS